MKGQTMGSPKWAPESVRFRAMVRGWHGWLHGALMLAMPVILVGAVATGQAFVDPWPWFIAYMVVVTLEGAHIATHLVTDKQKEEPPEQLSA